MGCSMGWITGLYSFFTYVCKIRIMSAIHARTSVHTALSLRLSAKQSPFCWLLSIPPSCCAILHQDDPCRWMWPLTPSFYSGNYPSADILEQAAWLAFQSVDDFPGHESQKQGKGRPICLEGPRCAQPHGFLARMCQVSRPPAEPERNLPPLGRGCWFGFIFLSQIMLCVHCSHFRRY